MGGKKKVFTFFLNKSFGGGGKHAPPKTKKKAINPLNHLPPPQQRNTRAPSRKLNKIPKFGGGPPRFIFKPGNLKIRQNWTNFKPKGFLLFPL